jgi:hypothetical protein
MFGFMGVKGFHILADFGLELLGFTSVHFGRQWFFGDLRGVDAERLASGSPSALAL